MKLRTDVSVVILVLHMAELPIFKLYFVRGSIHPLPYTSSWRNA
jgi:hypothetical protein